MEAYALLFAALNCAIAAIALLIDRLFGFPQGLFDMIRHPVSWMGSLISLLERMLNDPDRDASARRTGGIVMLLVLMAVVLLITVPLALILRGLPWGWAGEAVIASFFLSQHGLEKAVRDVRIALGKSLAEAREAVAHIIGRDTARLDTSGVTKGAIESLAENTSDGVTAPLLWLLVGGLPGVALYKAINTADSMVGYKSELHRDFGWASAKLDDLVNLPASRLTGLLFALAALMPGTGPGDGGKSFAAMRRDAPKHLSPNAGWPEAAMAGALDIRLGGPRSYGARKVELPWMGEGREKLIASDIDAALTIYNRTLNILIALVVVVWVVSLKV